MGDLCIDSRYDNSQKWVRGLDSFIWVIYIYLHLAPALIKLMKAGAKVR